ncbi:MAG TPA: amidase family protein [Nitriliruptorales bacterium]
MAFLFETPSDDAVRELARSLGIDLTPAENRLIAARVREFVEVADAVDELGLEEARLPLRHTTRTVARRPTADEDPHNAFIHVCHVEGDPDGPLQGIKVGLKDNIALAGSPMTLGWRPMHSYVPDFDATVVTRLLDAGATIVGKLNMEPLSGIGAGFGGVSDYGRVSNPRDPEWLTGASSSGPASAVAGGQADAAIGGDQGGSIRTPSAWCGVVGLKPTFGLVPHTGAFGSDPTVDHVGPIAPSVELVARLLDAIAGRDGHDPRQARVPEVLPGYVDGFGQGVEGLRVGVLTEGFPGSDLDGVVRAAIAGLESRGASAVDVSVPQHPAGSAGLWAVIVEGTRRLFDTNLGGAFHDGFYPTSLVSHFGRLRTSHASELPHFLKLILITAAAVDERHHGAVYAKGQNLRASFRALYDQALAAVDVLVMPTVTATAAPYVPPVDFEDALQRNLLAGDAIDPVSVGLNTNVFNLTGHPAITVPCGELGGLPVGLQVVGSHFDEPTILRVARAVEEAAGR